MLLVMQLYGFLKVQLQATLSRHDKGSTTLPEGVSTQKQKNGNLHIRADSAIYIQISRQINFIRLVRNLCRGNIFSFTINSNRSE